MSHGEIDGIVCLSPDTWGDVKRPQQLMRRLAEHVPVLYVEPPVCMTSAARPRRELGSALSRARWHRAIGHAPEQVEPGIHVLTPVAVAPEHRIGSIPVDAFKRMARARARRAVDVGTRRAVARLGFETPVIWAGHPTPVSDALLRHSSLVVYDCVDRWSDFPGPVNDPSWRRDLARCEERLTDWADVVFCSAVGLVEAMTPKASGEISLLRNGADVEHFLPAGRPVPADLADLPRPLVGYVGAVADWFDIALVRQLALARPAWSFVLVGPVFQGAISGAGQDRALLEGVPNLHLLGPRPYEQVPAYLEAFDTTIIPFKVNGLTEDTNPIKLYEYLAAGKPVVSTPLPEAAAVPTVRVADGVPGFLRALTDSLVDGNDEVRAARIATARHNSWEHRAEAAWSLIGARYAAQTAPAAAPLPGLRGCEA